MQQTSALMAVMNKDLEFWKRFYTTQMRSKDSDVWRQLQGREAAWREFNVRCNDERIEHERT